MTGGDAFESGLGPGEGIDAGHLGDFDERYNAAPGRATLVMSGEECVLLRQGRRREAVLDTVAVPLDATIASSGVMRPR